MPPPEDRFDPAPLAITPDRDGVRLRLRVVPGARREGILGVHGDALRVAVRAAPERGQANRAVEEMLAERVGLARSAVAIERGAASRDKTVRFAGIAADELRRRLVRAVAPESD